MEQLGAGFASAERSSGEEIKKDSIVISENKEFRAFLEAMPGFSAVLNENRQILYVNQQYLDMLGIESIEEILGKHPGESILCIHSAEEAGGCGTSGACAYCGAVNAVIESRTTHKKSVKETRLTIHTPKGERSLDLSVSVTPLLYRDKEYSIVNLSDISSEKRLQTLERMFFHDTINLAGGLSRAIDLLAKMPDKNKGNEIIQLSAKASRDLLDEILSFRQLRQAEQGDLALDRHRYYSGELLEFAVMIMRNSESALGKIIALADDSVNTGIITDRAVLLRILLNMLTNALEASGKGETVTAGVSIPAVQKIRFYVKNNSVIPPETGFQVFQRSFSTKGTNRGLGTYGMKLLGENYLRGKVGFSSTEKTGTEFFIDLPEE